MKNFRDIYTEHLDPVLRRFRRRGLSLDDSFDLAQQVFLRLYKMWDRYDERGRLVPLLSSICHSVWVDHLRALRPEDEQDFDAVAGRGPTPEKSAIESQRRDQLQRCLRQLSPRQQQVVSRKLQGDKGAEIARLLHLDVGSIKTHFFRARESLKNCLQDLAWQGLDHV